MKKEGKRKLAIKARSQTAYLISIESRVGRLEKLFHENKIDHSILKDGLAQIIVEIGAVKDKLQSMDNKLDGFISAVQRIEEKCFNK